MKTRITIAAFASLLLALFAVPGNAQYLTSTKAGFVNYANGKVYILRHDSEDGEKGRASLGTQMRNGDKLSTNADSYAEVLLNPGSYLRVNENAEICARNTDFGTVRFELVKGSVIAEIGEIDKKTPIEIVTPHGSIFIAKVGLYRIDEKDSAAIVSIRQGEIMIGTAADITTNKAAKYGRGKVVTLTGASKPEIAKINKDTFDSFDKWSFNRANTLTAANVSALRRNRTYRAFAGGWYYDPFYNCYTFMPFRRGFYSPYGFGFFNNYRDCYWYNPYGYGYGYGSGGGGGVVSNLPPRVVTGIDRAPIRREIEGRVLDSGSSIFDSGRSGGSFGSGSTSSPSSTSSPTVISSPAPSRDTGSSSGSGSMPTRRP